LFEDAFDIVAARLTPKPAEAAYEAFLERYKIDPECAAMFEDLLNNLVVPKAKGMTTVLVTGKAAHLDHREPHDQLSVESAPADADFVTRDLPAFLTRLNALLLPSD
jgi:putative hydrolase of the HAD superfamily